MWALAAIIPIMICCVLITGVISVVAFVGMGTPAWRSGNRK